MRPVVLVHDGGSALDGCAYDHASSGDRSLVESFHEPGIESIGPKEALQGWELFRDVRDGARASRLTSRMVNGSSLSRLGRTRAALERSPGLIGRSGVLKRGWVRVDLAVGTAGRFARLQVDSKTTLFFATAEMAIDFLEGRESKESALAHLPPKLADALIRMGVAAGLSGLAQGALIGLGVAVLPVSGSVLLAFSIAMVSDVLVDAAEERLSHALESAWTTMQSRHDEWMTELGSQVHRLESEILNWMSSGGGGLGYPGGYSMP